MLHVNDLSFRHGERVLFDRASAAMSDGWKVGLVGRNGAGKSTLLRLIQGQIEADGGSINLSGRTRIGSVPQDPPGGEITVLDTVLAADVERTALLAEAEACHDGLRLADIHARLDEIDAPRRRRAPPRSCTAWASTTTPRRGPAANSPAAGACAWRWPARCSAIPTC